MKPHVACAVLCLCVLLCSAFAQSPESYQKAAAAALKSQLSQGQDCPNLETTREANECLAGVEERANDDLQTFYRNLQQLLKADAADLQRLLASQDKWSEYVASACGAIDYLYARGSIRVSAVSRCMIQLTRSRMRDLDALYHTVLHN